VAVVGFDGVEESNYKTPPLTTVIQPLHELGSTAVDTLLEISDGKKTADRILMCEPRIRQSCGCPPGRPFNLTLTELPPQTPVRVRTAVDTLTSLVLNHDEDGFISHLNTILASELRSGGDLKVWNDHLSVVRYRAEEKQKRASGQDESLFEFARVLIGDIAYRHQAERRVVAENKLATLRSVSASLSGGFEMSVILQRLENGLAELGKGKASLFFLKE